MQRDVSRPSRRVRQFYASRRLERRLLRGVDAAFRGAWLGLLDRDALAVLDASFYRTTREKHDGRSLSYLDQEWTRRGLFDWEHRAIEAAFPPAGRVVVTGAGGGREMLPLLDMGYEVTGYEPHGGLVAAGTAFLAQEGHMAQLLQNRPDEFPVGGAWDAVIVGWSSYMLIPGRKRRVAFLQAARRSVSVGAPLLASFYLRTAEDEARLRLQSRIANVLRWLRRGERVELGDDFATDVVTNFVHRFSSDEIIDEFAAGGWKVASFHRDPYPHVVAQAA